MARVTAEVFTGPKGGKYYITSHGTKHYGHPPSEIRVTKIHEKGVTPESAAKGASSTGLSSGVKGAMSKHVVSTSTQETRHSTTGLSSGVMGAMPSHKPKLSNSDDGPKQKAYGNQSLMTSTEAHSTLKKFLAKSDSDSISQKEFHQFKMANDIVNGHIRPHETVRFTALDSTTPPGPRRETAVTRTVTPTAAPVRVTGISAKAKALYDRLPYEHQDAIEKGGFGHLLNEHPTRFRTGNSNNGGGTYSGGYVKSEVPRVNYTGSPPPRRDGYSMARGSNARVFYHDSQSTLVHELSHHLHFSLAKMALQKSKDEIGPPNSENSFSNSMHKALRVEKEHTSSVEGQLLSKINAHYNSYGNGRGVNVVSRYSKGNVLEFFAEHHAAYVQKKDEHKKNFPEVHETLRQVRKQMGMPE